MWSWGFYPMEWWVKIRLYKICENLPHFKTLPMANKEIRDETGRGVAREHCGSSSSDGYVISTFRILS
jgi:hypothetical protein